MFTCFPANHHVIVGGGLAPTVWQRTSTNFPAETGSFLFRIITVVGPTVKEVYYWILIQFKALISLYEGNMIVIYFYLNCSKAKYNNVNVLRLPFKNASYTYKISTLQRVEDYKGNVLLFHLIVNHSVTKYT